jgi:hypothetical protein
MAGIFDMDAYDPRNFGLLQAGGALLTPQSQGGGLGAAASAFGKTVSTERQNEIDAQLKKLLIESRRRDMSDPQSNLPSDVRSTNEYVRQTPEWRQAYELVTKQAKIFDVAGIKYTRDANGNVVQLTSTQEAALNAEILARAKKFGEKSEEVRFTTEETVDSQNKPTTSTIEEILRSKGALPTAPRFPNALSAPFNPVAHVAGPPAQRPTGGPAGVPIDGYPATRAGLDQARADLVKDPIFGNIRPASAGASTRVAESEGAKNISSIYKESYNGALEAASSNRALDKVSKIIEEGKATGGPLAAPEVWARNLLSEFGVPLNNAIDKNNAQLQGVATVRLAEKIIKGGRGLTDHEGNVIAAAFPGWKSGIPLAQLPAFIEMVRSMNNDTINVWKGHKSRMKPSVREEYPDDEPTAAPGAANDLRKKYGLPPL